jgi:hypothetical protein
VLSEDLLALLELQGGVVLHDQALHHGVRRRELGSPGSGRPLVRIRNGAYASAELLQAATPAWRVALRVAAERVCSGIDLIAFGSTAAAIHGLPTLGRSNGLQLRERVADRPLHHGHSANLTAADVTEVLGVPVTTAARTAVDVARVRDLARGVVTADAALRAGVARKELSAALERARGWPGIVQARLTVEFADAGADSALESLGRVRMHEHGLPPPMLQAVIRDEDGPFARVDHYWEDLRVVGEADGALKYDEPGSLFLEKQREDRMRDMGLAVVRYTWDEAMHRSVIMIARFRRAFERQSRAAA